MPGGARYPLSRLAKLLSSKKLRGSQPNSAGSSRAHLGTTAWPSAREWQALRTQTGGHLLALGFPRFSRKHAPGLTTSDERPGASPDHHFWTGDGAQAGWFIHAYQSTWLPAALLAPQRQGALVDALCAAAAQWDVELHFNKGLAGAPVAALAATRDTAMNPAVLDAFALAIIAGGGGPAFPGMPGAKVDEARARHAAVRIRAGIDALRMAAPDRRQRGVERGRVHQAGLASSKEQIARTGVRSLWSHMPRRPYGRDRAHRR